MLDKYVNILLVQLQLNSYFFRKSFVFKVNEKDKSGIRKFIKKVNENI